MGCRLIQKVGFLRGNPKNNTMGVLYEYDPILDSLTVKLSLEEPGRYRMLRASNNKLYFITTSSMGTLREYELRLLREHR